MSFAKHIYRKPDMISFRIEDNCYRMFPIKFLYYAECVKVARGLKWLEEEMEDQKITNNKYSRA